MVGVGNRHPAPSPSSALPPAQAHGALQHPFATAAPPCISGRTSYLRVRLEFLPYPQVIPHFCNSGGCGPRRGLTPASPCPWIAHPVSGLIPATNRLCTPRPSSDRAPGPGVAPQTGSLSLRLRGSVRRLTSSRGAPKDPRCRRRDELAGSFYKRHAVTRRDAPKKSARTFGLRLLAGAGVQVLFHPPSGVLFTFPSRYSCTIGGQWVFRLGGWSPQLPTGFPVSRGTQVSPPPSQSPSPTGLSPSAAPLPSGFG